MERAGTAVEFAWLRVHILLQGAASQGAGALERTAGEWAGALERAAGQGAGALERTAGQWSTAHFDGWLCLFGLAGSLGGCLLAFCCPCV